jgi:hypothetical protein
VRGELVFAFVILSSNHTDHPSTTRKLIRLQKS